MGIPWGFDGEHGTDVRPPHVAALKAWAKNESQPGANDGTRVTAGVVNRIVGNVRSLADAAGTALTESSDEDVANAVIALIGKTDPAPHNHDTRYYQKFEADSLLSTKVPIASIVDNLASTSALVPLSAAQGKVLKDLIDGLGDITPVADLAEAATLTGIDRGDLIHVSNDGSGKWARYQVLGAGDGTWAGCTKVLLWTQDQAPATHGHVAGDITDASPNGRSLITASNYAAMRGLLGLGSAALADRDEILAAGRRLTFKQVADLADDETLSYDEVEDKIRVLPGDIVEAQGWRYEVAAQDAVDPDLATPALINLFVRPNEQGYVNIEQYGLVGAGSNDHAKLQRALDSGYGVIIPRGSYLIAAPLEQTVAGQRIVCVGKEDSVVYSSSVTPHDVLRVRGTHAEVDGGMWRGTMAVATSREEQTAVIRVLSGLASIHDTRLLSNTNGNGSLITLDNWDPVTGSVIAGGGRYFHNIQRNRLGSYTTGYPYAAIRAFLYEIGLHATNIQFNHIIADRGVMLGGASGAGASAGNRIIANTIQSATGTISVKAGIGVDIAAYGGLDVVFANYLELYTNGILLRRTDDTSGISIGQFGANTFDNCTTPLGSLGARRYVSQDYQQLIDQWNGWNWRYASEQQADFHAPGAGTSMLQLHSGGAVAPMILASRDKQAITLTANDQEIVPTSSQGAINGSGANRTGITIRNGAYEGQELTLTANTWGATIDNDGGTGGVQNCYFAANASSVVMGNASGNIARLKLKWVSAFISGNGCWVEESRLVRP